MRSFFAKTATFLILFAFLTSPLVASDTFTDKDEWSESVCGDRVDSDFESVMDASGNPVFPGDNIVSNLPNNQVLAWGIASQENNSDLIETFVNGDLHGFIAREDEPVSFDLDPTQGPLEGFCFRHFGNSFQLTFFDGDTVVDTQTVFVDELITIDDEAFFGWTNTDGLNVTRIEMIALDPAGDIVSLFFISNFQFSFNGGNCNNDPTPQEQLDEVIANLDAIGPTGSSLNDYLIGCAIAYLECANNPVFFTEDGLLNNDIAYFFFAKTKVASFFLSNVDGIEAVDQALLDIQAALSNVVDMEIAAATAAGGDADDLASAAYLQADADALTVMGKFTFATKKRMFAWFCANYSY